MSTRRDGAVDKRRVILDAAITVFAREGFHRCRVSDIANEANVAYGLVYHYFRSKDEVLNTIFTERWSLLLETIGEADRQDLPVRDKLYAIAAFIIESYRNDPELMKVIIVEVTRAANTFGSHTWRDPPGLRRHRGDRRRTARRTARSATTSPPLRDALLLRRDRAAPERLDLRGAPQEHAEFEQAKEMVVETICAGLAVRYRRQRLALAVTRDRCCTPFVSRERTLMRTRGRLPLRASLRTLARQAHRAAPQRDRHLRDPLPVSFEICKPALAGGAHRRAAARRLPSPRRPSPLMRLETSVAPAAARGSGPDLLRVGVALHRSFSVACGRSRAAANRRPRVRSPRRRGAASSMRLPLCAAKVTSGFIVAEPVRALEAEVALVSSGPLAPPSSDIEKLLTGRSGTLVTVERMSCRR